jgi:hypothetical protein
MRVDAFKKMGIKWGKKRLLKPRARAKDQQGLKTGGALYYETPARSKRLQNRTAAFHPYTTLIIPIHYLHLAQNLINE